MEASGAFDRDPARRRVDPSTSGELGEAPGHLSDEQAAVWNELAAILPIGVARNADRFSFELITSLMLSHRTTGLRGPALSTLTSLLSRFGLDPASRSKVAAPVSTRDAANPFYEFV